MFHNHVSGSSTKPLLKSFSAFAEVTASNGFPTVLSARYFYFHKHQVSALPCHDIDLFPCGICNYILKSHTPAVPKYAPASFFHRQIPTLLLLIKNPLFYSSILLLCLLSLILFTSCSTLFDYAIHLLQFHFIYDNISACCNFCLHLIHIIHKHKDLSDYFIKFRWNRIPDL